MLIEFLRRPSSILRNVPLSKYYIHVLCTIEGHPEGIGPLSRRLCFCVIDSQRDSNNVTALATTGQSHDSLPSLPQKGKPQPDFRYTSIYG